MPLCAGIFANSGSCINCNSFIQSRKHQLNVEVSSLTCQRDTFQLSALMKDSHTEVMKSKDVDMLIPLLH